MNKYFSVTDKERANTCLYEIVENEIQVKNIDFDTESTDENTVDFYNDPKNIQKKYSLEKLPFTKIRVSNHIIKNFDLDDLKGNELLFITYLDDRVIINVARVNNDEIEVSSNNIVLNYDVIDSEDAQIRTEFIYTPSKDRKVFILDVETGEEVEIEFYLKENKKIGISKLIPGKKYLALEFRSPKTRSMAAGICAFEEFKGKYKTKINEKEAKRFELVEIFKRIDEGKKQTFKIRTDDIERNV